MFFSHNRSEQVLDSELNVVHTLKHLFGLGAEAEKTVLGVPLYGRTFLLNNITDNGLGAKAEESFKVMKGPNSALKSFFREK